MAEWLDESTARDALALAAGTLLAFFGWDFFRLVRLAAGACAGALCGLSVYLAAGVPAALAEMGVGPNLWMASMMGVFALGGFLLLRQIKTIGSFLPGVFLGFLTGKALLRLFGDTEPFWSLSPVEVLLAGIVGGAAVLVSEREAVVVMTAFVGSSLAGSAVPWKGAPFFFFAFSAPLQWWLQAGRPTPFRRERQGDKN